MCTQALVRPETEILYFLLENIFCFFTSTHDPYAPLSPTIIPKQPYKTCLSVQTLLLIYQFQMIAQEKHVAVVKFRALTEKAFNVLSLIYPGICSNGAVSLNYSNPFLLSGFIYLSLLRCEGCEYFTISPQYKNANFVNFCVIQN